MPENHRKIEISFHYLSVGCQVCYFTGYKGRKAIYEVINVTKELTEKIKQSATENDEYLKLNRIDKLAENAMKLFCKGDTSLEEVYPFLLNES